MKPTITRAWMWAPALFALSLIINGSGDYCVESQTRDNKRMDLLIDEKGERFIIELKIWRGEKYPAEGEQQLAGYLKRMRLDQGYLLTYSIKKSKEIVVKTVMAAALA